MLRPLRHCERGIDETAATKETHRQRGMSSIQPTDGLLRYVRSAARNRTQPAVRERFLLPGALRNLPSRTEAEAERGARQIVRGEGMNGKPMKAKELASA